MRQSSESQGKANPIKDIRLAAAVEACERVEVWVKGAHNSSVCIRLEALQGDFL